MYLGGSMFRIHGSNEPETIGQAVSSGCIRLTNADVVDLYNRVRVGTPVVVPADLVEDRAPEDGREFFLAGLGAAFPILGVGWLLLHRRSAGKEQDNGDWHGFSGELIVALATPDPTG
jgi:hypothetical protein